MLQTRMHGINVHERTAKLTHFVHLRQDDHIVIADDDTPYQRNCGADAPANKGCHTADNQQEEEYACIRQNMSHW